MKTRHKARVFRTDYARKLVARLEDDLEFLRERLAFFEGKCERLELSIATTAAIPAQREYAQRSAPPQQGSTQSVPLPAHISFRDLKEKWIKLSAVEQEKAVNEGWNVQEETI